MKTIRIILATIVFIPALLVYTILWVLLSPCIIISVLMLTSLFTEWLLFRYTRTSKEMRAILYEEALIIPIFAYVLMYEHFSEFIKTGKIT